MSHLELVARNRLTFLGARLGEAWTLGIGLFHGALCLDFSCPRACIINDLRDVDLFDVQRFLKDLTAN